MTGGNLVEEGNNVRKIPLLPLRGLMVFPYMVIHFDVGREKSIAALEEAMLSDQLIFLTSQKDAKIDEPDKDELYKVGTISKIRQLLKLPGDTIRVLVEGLHRAKVLEYLDEEKYFEVVVEEHLDEVLNPDVELEALMRTAVSNFDKYSKLSKKVTPETLLSIVSVEEPGRLADLISAHLPLKFTEKQSVLEMYDVVERIEYLNDLLLKEIEVLEIEKKINLRVKKQMEKSQREYYLREQMKAIQKELGEADEKKAEAEEYRDKIAKAKLPKDIEEKIIKELERLEKMPPAVAEAVVIRNYLDWILALPWAIETEDRLDVDEAEKVLNEDHFGLKKVKERILEYLAIRQLAKKMKGPILCLVGPPGVGKTSLAKSVARSLDRKFVRISLGGVRDEAEIRGHRKTYVGAMPGRIIQGMKNAGTKNPVFLLDEIDKMSSDFRGDPSSALLEVLDPEQNSNFSDHFIEYPFDLSKVMFITTANTTHSIPQPLLDRMEVIHIPGYTEDEKVRIAADYLLPKQVEEHGLKKGQLNISELTLTSVIQYYTREAGVRNLERQIATICRKTARRVVQKDAKLVKVTPQNLKNFLGIPKFRYGELHDKDQVGVVTGLAWTQVGGEILNVEVTVMEGKGSLTLTGKLGDVMQESARAGYSYTRSKAEVFGIEQDFHQKKDIHIHVPEGAIPKDGPSAGITIATALISALSGKPVKRDVAMTGEITLRGRVLPIGGVKEKVLAAHRAGIHKIILPKENAKDLEDVPQNVKKKITFILADHMDNVLEHALVLGDDNENNKS
jgi:ATP-dependent Lon protease